MPDDITALRAALHTAHDHLHHDRIDQAHQALHCALGEAVLDTGNVSATDAAALQSFVVAFNQLAQGHGLLACTVVFVPSATKEGFTSIQMGGNVYAIQSLRHLLGAGPTTAAGGPR